MDRLIGLGVSSGLGAGRALVLARRAHEVRYLVAPDAVDAELARLDAARGKARRQLHDIKARMGRAVGTSHAYLFDAQLLMLDDPMLTGRAAEIVREKHINVESALDQAAAEIGRLLEEISDPYLRERHGDVADLIGRLRLNLRGEGPTPAELIDRLSEPGVLVADDLPPSLAAQIDWRRIAAFVTAAGSWTSHTAILARSLHVPAVVGLSEATRRIAPGQMVLVDGASGDVILEPTAAQIDEAADRRARRAAHDAEIRASASPPASTADGTRIHLHANIDVSSDASRAREYGAEAIGLFRSEFLLAARPEALEDEEIQYRAYRDLVERMAPAEVTIRTFDRVAGHDPWESAGPSDRLGLRALRLGLAERGGFRTQLRALLRAARFGPLRVLLPFVSGADEIREARGVLDEAARELRDRGETPGEVEFGAMIEVPAAAMAADLIAREADFLSVGTNDLIQYTLAVDRTDERVSHLYDPLHPAVLRLIRLVIRAARHAGRRAAVCGEMARDPMLVAILIGLGVRELSMAPAAIPDAKAVIRDLRVDDARRLAWRALREDRTRDLALTVRLEAGRPLGGPPPGVVG